MNAPTADQLAAYLDGALAPCDRARVHRWLMAHPEQCDELTRPTPMQLPTVSMPRHWNTLGSQIDAGCCRGWRRRRNRQRMLIASFSVMLFSLFWLKPQPSQPVLPGTDPAIVMVEDEPLILASAGDVLVFDSASIDEDGIAPESSLLWLTSHK